MNRSLLIVEDDTDLLEILARWFTRAGYSVVSVVDPRLALEAADLREFGVALIDLGLPGMDGVELMRRLTRVQDAMQVIILSGYDYPVREAQVEGIFASILKPCSLKVLNAIVDDAFARAADSEVVSARPLIANQLTSIDESPSRPKGCRLSLDRVECSSLP